MSKAEEPQNESELTDIEAKDAAVDQILAAESINPHEYPEDPSGTPTTEGQRKTARLDAEEARSAFESEDESKDEDEDEVVEDDSDGKGVSGTFKLTDEK